MKTSKANQQHLYGVEEHFRNVWQPVIVTKGKDEGTQKTVKITEREAEIMNSQSKYHKVRYVLKKDEKPVEEINIKDAQVVEEGNLKAKYKEVIGKSPYHGWDDNTLREKIEEHIKNK